jgi:hypothetical protein
VIDILNAQKGDIIVYGRYASGSATNPMGSLTDNRYFGIYQDFTFWSPDGGPIKLWINVIGQDGAGKAIYPSQVVNAFRGVTC